MTRAQRKLVASEGPYACDADGIRSRYQYILRAPVGVDTRQGTIARQRMEAIVAVLNDACADHAGSHAPKDGGR